jgi:hypothetical protein
MPESEKAPPMLTRALLAIFLAAALPLNGLLAGCADSDDLWESQRELIVATGVRSVEASNAASRAIKECDESIKPFGDQVSSDLTPDARARIFQPCLVQGQVYTTECIEALANEAEVLDAKHGTNNAANIRIACTNAIVANKAAEQAFHSANQTLEQVLMPP